MQTVEYLLFRLAVACLLFQQEPIPVNKLKFKVIINNLFETNTQKKKQDKMQTGNIDLTHLNIGDQKNTVLGPAG